MSRRSIVALGIDQAPYRTVTKKISASGVVYAKPCLLVCLKVYPAAVDRSAIVTDDASDGTGAFLDEARAKANDLYPAGETHIMTPAEVGLYCTLAGAGAYACVRYIPLALEPA